MSRVSKYPQVPSMGDNDYFLIDTYPITTNSTSKITLANVASSITPEVLPATFTTNGTVKQTVYNVRDYGAVGDGVTDDTSAIQAAFTACMSGGGGIIRASSGTYIVTGLVFVGSNYIFEGVGSSTIFKLKASANTDVICCGDASTAMNNITFRNFQIDGNKANQPTNPPLDGERCGLRLRCDSQNCYYIVVDNVYAHDTKLNGISVESSYFTTVRNCRSENNQNYGIWWENSDLNVIDGNSTKSNGSGGVAVNSAGNGSVVNNISEYDQSTALAFISAASVSVIGNKVFEAGFVSGGSNTAAIGIIVTISEAMTVLGNTITDSQGHGMQINGTTSSSFSHNVFRKNGQLTNNTYADMYFTNAGGGSAVQNNDIIGNTFINDTDGNSPNVVAYNMQFAQSNVHMPNNIYGNQFGTPGTALTLNLGSTLGYNATTVENAVGANGILNPQGYYYYGYFAATQALDWTKGDLLYGVGYYGTTLTIANGLFNGQKFTLIYNQDVGNKTLTLPSNANAVGQGTNATLPLSTAANSVDIIDFVWDGTYWDVAVRANPAVYAPIASPTFTGTATSPVFLANGPYNETTTTPGTYLGTVSGTERIMFANGTAAQNWEIDNNSGTMRFLLPGASKMTLDPTNATSYVNSIPGVGATYNLGSSTLGWNNVYALRHYFNSTAYIDGSSAGLMAVTGELTVQTPTNASDAATKAYVDSVAQGLSVKASVQVATAAALPTNTYLAGVITITATGVLTVDGQTVNLNDRVLVQNEAAQANNGIYLCTTAGAVTNATLTTALTVNTGTLTLTANSANTSVLTIGAGAVSISGSNTGDQTNISGNAAGLSATLVVGSGGTGTATAFTSGSVVFAGTSGVYSQDNTAFFWNDTNRCLQLTGASGGAATNTGLRFINGVGGQTWAMQSGSPSVSNSNFSLIDITNSSTERLTLTTSGFFGIGLTSPKVALSVKGASMKTMSPTAVNATATLTAAQVITGYITSTSAAAVTMTMPTGTLLGTALGAAQGTVFDLYIDNTAGANTVTIAVGVNAIQSAMGGTLTVPSGVTGQACFRLMFSSATAYTFTRIA